MLRTHRCDELNLAHVGQHATLCGWVSKIRDKGGLIWVDLRDRYGLTQLVAEEGTTATEVLEGMRSLGREFVLRATGIVVERYNKNPNLSTGDIEVRVADLQILNASALPPFLIEDDTDGGEDLRMQYRYLDIRRNPVRSKLELRHRMAQEVRKYLDGQSFIEVETPVLIKTTPEGARDFVVPSRMHPGQFYALPQSPQTFKQLLMVGGLDRYFQIVKCFRDEDLRADRQPEFTQIDCEMSFVERSDILAMFEGLFRHLFQQVKGLDIGEIPVMTYADAMLLYGNDKPDLRWTAPLVTLKGGQAYGASPFPGPGVEGVGFGVFEEAEAVIGVPVPGGAGWTRKELDALTEWVKRPQIGMKGMVWLRCEAGEATYRSSVDKFYGADHLKAWMDAAGLGSGDLMLVLAGPEALTRKAAAELRLEIGNRLGFRSPDQYRALWVVDFPLLDWDEESGRWVAMHHPFTSPLPEDMELMQNHPGRVRANAYDMVLNGTEIGGGSIRIHDKGLQARLFELLGFGAEEAQAKFGFLLKAFEYGAPPHGGIAFGFDRLCALFGGQESIRDFIAFPKNNAGRDVMIDAPSGIDEVQRKELGLP
jgi:aspartyl-tRNA synthetase